MKDNYDKTIDKDSKILRMGKVREKDDDFKAKLLLRDPGHMKKSRQK
jgi:hypothetical protein